MKANRLFLLLAGCLLISAAKTHADDKKKEKESRGDSPAGSFSGRIGKAREQLLRESGGSARSEAAVAAGLTWIVSHQSPEGKWSLHDLNKFGRCNCLGHGMDNDIAATAFGLLPLLGTGQTHKSIDGKDSHYAKNVERGLRYLMSQQKKEGNFGGQKGGAEAYGNGLATIALCEAYGLTVDPTLKAPAQRALDFIAKAQNDKGGWDYSPRGPRTDTSIGGWQLMALKSGQMAGLDVPAQTLAGATKWLDRCASSSGASYGYAGPVADGASAMTAVGLLCRQYQGWGPRHPGLIEGVKLLKTAPPDKAGTMYYNYYATQVMHHMGGETWDFWNPKIRDLLIVRQDKGDDPKHPHQKGSWSPQGDSYGKAGGRLMVTSMSLLTLEVYYRHLPLYHRDN